MSSRTYYKADLIEALIPKKGPGKSSDVYIKIHVEGQPPQKTSVYREDGKAVWNEHFILPIDAPAQLEIKQKHEPFFKRWLKTESWRESRSLGKVRLDAAAIFGQTDVTEPQDVRLDFPSDEGLHHDISKSGYILVRLHRPENLEEHVQQTRSSVEQSLSALVSQLDKFVQIVGVASLIHPYLNLTWQVVSSLYTIVKGQLDRDKRIADLANMMEDLYTFVDDVKSFPSRLSSLEETIKKILFQTIECSLFIQEYSGHGFCRRTFNSQWAEEQIARFVQTLTTLKTSLNTGVGVQIALIAHRMYEDVQSIVRTQSLAKLLPANMDDPSRPTCLPQTRSDLLSNVLSWAMNPSSDQNILWLHGPAGSGKSTIATTIANIARDLGRLGAFVFFNRGIAERNDPTSVIRTLAFQLGEFDRRLGGAISNVIENTPSIRQSPLRQQFYKLIRQPLSEIPVWSQEGPVIVVIDALDECGHVGDREDLLDVLALESVKLPLTLRIVVVSRTEVDIQNALGAQENICSTPIDISSAANDKDIHLYLYDRLRHIRSKNKYLSLPQNWPGHDTVNALTARACGLFIWGFTACRYVENGQDPEERLADLLRTDICLNAESAMDIMYSTALESAGKWEDPAFAADFRDILGIVIVARNPLTALTIDCLKEATPVSRTRPVLHTIQYFGCVFRGVTHEEPLRVIHPSFEDFITDRARCKNEKWFIDVFLYRQRLARQCIGCLRAKLKRNMCKLTLTKGAVDVILPEDVTYSCLFWIEHVCESEGSVEWLSTELHEFLVKHLLHWIEAMSLLKKARQTVGLLMRLEDWSKASQVHHQELCDLLADAVRFCQAFTPVIEQHPLLVYNSALPFTPVNSTLYQIFKDEPSIPVVAGGFRDEWSPLLMDIPRPGGEVTSLSLSPDGSQLLSSIARGCYVWDATSGELVIQGPKGVAMAVFSPGGQLAASCLFNGSIVLWDTFSGKIIGHPLEPHQGAIYAVAFSPDGIRLISGGQSCSIIMWDVQAGTIIRDSPVAHRKTLMCLVFSPDGSRYASGSRDGTIRVWDAGSGDMVLGPLQGHSGGIYSLAFTPDGMRIVSGSDDKIVCIWDAQADPCLNGEWDAQRPIKLCGHRSVVFSVAVSPDGQFIASASKDTTVRLWSLESKKELSHLIRRHRMPVRCVAFWQQCGRLRLVTGAHDATVRIWDIESVGSMGVARKHKGLVSHIAFSPDGQRIVSGSLDHTVQLWDPKTGQCLMHRLVLEQQVHSVALTADNLRILAADRDGAVFAWDATTGAPVTATPADDPQYHSVIGPLFLQRRWITDSKTGTVVTMLPTMSPVRSQASSGNCMALGLANGGIVIINFPPQLV